MSHVHNEDEVTDLYAIGHADRIRVTFESDEEVRVEYDLKQLSENNTILYQLGSKPELVYETDQYHSGRKSAFMHLVNDIESQQNIEITKIVVPEYLYEQFQTEVPYKPIESDSISNI